MKFYESIGIRPPMEEFERYAKAKIDTLTRLGGQSEELEAYLDAFELGKKLIREAQGLTDDDR